MKKIIAILLIIISMFSFFILFNNEKQKQISNMEKAEQNLKNSYEIIIPDSVSNENQADIYKEMTSVLKKHKADIYYSRIGTNSRIIKFTYFSDLNYFNKLFFTKGRIFNVSENESHKFLSSENTGKTNQIGKLATFDGKQIFEIHTLKSMIDSNKYSLSGYCTVQINSKDNINTFIKDLESSLNITDIQIMSKDNLNIDYSYNKWILPCLYFIITLLVLYSILKSYKKYGVQMMLGYSNKKIWLDEISELIFIQCIILVFADIFMSAYLFKELNQYYMNFLKLVLTDNIKQIIIFFIISSVPFIYVNNIKISNMLKNKLPLSEMLIFNSLIKIIIIILFFNLAAEGIQNYTRISNIFNNKYKAWDGTKEYYIIPEASSKNGDIDMDKLYKAEPPLYRSFNKDGAIMADFSSFSPTQRKFALADKEPYYESDFVLVNPNYLKKNIIYGTSNKPISISENDNKFIMLIPEKFKKDENIIKKFYDTHFKTDDFLKKQDYKIIYTKCNQELFSYELDINPSNGNMVKDPLVIVITEKNGENENYGIIGIGGSPVKIKVPDSSNSEGYIRAKLEAAGLDKYVEEIVPVGDEIAAEIKSVHELLVYIAGGFIILSAAILLVITQNIFCYFESYKKRLAIRQLNGYGTIAKCREYFLLMFFTWIIIFLIKIYQGGLKLTTLSILIAAFMFIELIITVWAIKLVSKRKIAEVIKGS